MSVATAPRKPLGVRATPEQHKLLSEAAAREHRSLSGFVLTAALRAAHDQARSRTPQKTQAEVEAAVRRAQELMKPYLQPRRSLVDELIAERREEAARE